MDLTPVDTDPPLQSKSDADLALYLATSNTSSSRVSPQSWHAADNGYEYGQNSLGLYDARDHLGYTWSEEEVDRYVVANHPLVDNETDFSDHSHTTDTGSRGSSNLYSDPSFVPHGNSGLRGERLWRNFSTYSPRGHETLLPPLELSSPDHRDLHLPESHLTMYLPSSTSGSPFLGSSGVNVLPHPHHSPHGSDLLLPTPHELFVDTHLSHSPLSSASSSLPPSSSEERYVSLEELSAPYIPVKDAAADAELRATSSSDDTPLKNSARKARLGNKKSTREGRGGARGGRRNGPTRLDSAPKAVSASTASHSKRRRPSLSSSSDTSIASQVSIPLHKRPKRKAASKAETTFTDSDSGNDSGEAYLPSRSPSPYASASDYTRSPSPAEYAAGRSKKRGAAKGTGVPKMGAAEALAQLAAEKSKLENGGSDGHDWQPYHVFEGRPRKNGTIPLPVPVPHLTKKSRGRKVPYVDARAARPVASEDDYNASASGSRGTPARRGRGGNRGASGGRSFVCAVPGCGKCFVRGEHLKRHVRSIHTHDKRESHYFTFQCSFSCVNIQPTRVPTTGVKSLSVDVITLDSMSVCTSWSLPEYLLMSHLVFGGSSRIEFVGLDFTFIQISSRNAICLYSFSFGNLRIVSIILSMCGFAS
jgi:hypothetical protein